MTVTVLETEFYSEGASIGDIDGDGHNDVVAGPFWWQGPDFSSRHEIYEPIAVDPLDYSDNFVSFVEDIDGDGAEDVAVVGYPGEQAVWYLNPGNGVGVWERVVLLEGAGGETPMLLDLDTDGEGELLVVVDGHFGVARRVPDPRAPWAFTPVTGAAYMRFSHGLGAGDVNGDGLADLLNKDGWWEQPAVGATWVEHAFPFSDSGGAQMHASDLDGDGDMDVISSVAAHGFGLAWYEQLPDGSFERHLITDDTGETEQPYGVRFSQPHAVAIVDIDRDGVDDIVTGKRWWAHGPDRDPEPNAEPVLYVFYTRRESSGVTFEPHLLGSELGVGVAIAVGDLDGDDNPDVAISNKRGIAVYRSRP